MFIAYDNVASKSQRVNFKRVMLSLIFECFVFLFPDFFNLTILSIEKILSTVLSTLQKI